MLANTVFPYFVTQNWVFAPQKAPIAIRAVK